LHIPRNRPPRCGHQVCGKLIRMPALIARAFNESKVPLMWVCSDCDVLFSLDNFPGARLKKSDLRQVNRNFRKHCKQKHPRAVIIELELPEQGSPA
jgi:hypothetical protein